MEQLFLTIFIALFALECLVEFVLNELNLRYVHACWFENKIPDFFQGRMDSEQYDKSVQYTLAKGHVQRWGELYDRVITLLVLFGGGLAFIDRLAAGWAQALSLGLYGQGVIFCLAIALLFVIVSLPTDLYSTFGLEAKFGFNKTTVGLYVTDRLKGLILGLVIGVPFLLVIFWLMDVMGNFWWLWAFAFITAFQLVMIVIFPSFIAPWFNKFEPLKDGEFRERILALAKQLGFQTSGIFTMDGSKRSAHSNAYFTGIGKAKRIVLFDTLIEQMTMEQGLAVLAHEMGHYKMKHIRRMLLVQSVFLFIGLYLLSIFLNAPWFFSAFGLAPSHHAALVLFSIVAGPATFYLGPLMNRLSRRHEYEADRFAAKTLGEAKPMEEALINLTVKNLSNLNPHPWYSAYHYSHPTPAERISAIRQCLT
ncbi:MAG TPA: M48 family metallopeptidase [Candidatus Limnocylindrales bacterium]|nr:M48 family metallopeptidase [Candidatus Limnocylindrales bacterium]